MVKERDDTIKNLRAKLEDVYEGRETDVRANPLPTPRTYFFRKFLKQQPGLFPPKCVTCRPLCIHPAPAS
jgi:hypothetical protein